MGKRVCKRSVAISDVTVVMSIQECLRFKMKRLSSRYIVSTLNKGLLIGHSTDCCTVLFITPDCVHCTRKDSAKGVTSLHCPKMSSAWVNGNNTVSTNEGELI